MTENVIMVSVILPTYNMAKVLPRAIDSVLRQTFKEFELIIIDDASVDDTDKVVMSYTDHRIIYLRRENNHLREYFGKGILDNPRNDGLRTARGKYISYIDHDDVYRERRLEILFNFLEKNSNIGLIYCDSMWHRNADGLEMVSCNRSIDFNKEYFKYGNFFAPSEVMHRIECYKVCGNWTPMGQKIIHPSIKQEYLDNNFIGIEDWNYWIRIADHFNIAHIKEILVDKIHKTYSHYLDRWYLTIEPEAKDWWLLYEKYWKPKHRGYIKNILLHIKYRLRNFWYFKKNNGFL